MDVSFAYTHDLYAILEAVPAADRRFHELAIETAFVQLDAARLEEIEGALYLYELCEHLDDFQTGELITYGFVLELRTWGFEALAYWRDPVTAGFARDIALNLALQRRNHP